MISLGVCREGITHMNGTQSRIKDMAHVLDYRHLNLNLLGDLLVRDYCFRSCD